MTLQLRSNTHHMRSQIGPAEDSRDVTYEAYG